MKKVSLFLGTFLILLTLGSKTYAQREEGKFVITAGAGFSLGAFIASVAELDNGYYSYSNDYNFRTIPAINLMADYAFVDGFSVGVAATHQIFLFDYNSYDSYDQSTNTTITYPGFTQKVTRTNVGIRVLYHMSKNERIDVYTGLRVGASLWGDSDDNSDPNYVYTGFDKDLRFAPQALFGTRFFFTENIGLNLEVAIGPPYYFMTGLNVKF